MKQHPGFNPRAQQSSNALAGFVTDDLRRSSLSIRTALDAGTLKEKKNAPVATRFVTRNVDLVLHDGATPALTVFLAVENKTIMAAHGKARKNRFGDLIAFANHMHNHRRECIAAGLIVINMSAAYENPDPFAKGLTRANFDMSKVVADTIALFAGIPLREGRDEPSDSPEALGVIVVDYDGVAAPKLVGRPPAPQRGDVLNYENFLSRISRLYEVRFADLTG